MVEAQTRQEAMKFAYEYDLRDVRWRNDNEDIIVVDDICCENFCEGCSNRQCDQRADIYFGKRTD
ncbi:MAG: hypothetical protein FWF51_12075 [Chitinivibrionia bacterium]|nr:hypothetical protein [Chitinivibrionia bacterium]